MRKPAIVAPWRQPVVLSTLLHWPVPSVPSDLAGVIRSGQPAKLSQHYRGGGAIPVIWYNTMRQICGRLVLPGASGSVANLFTEATRRSAVYGCRDITETWFTPPFLVVPGTRYLVPGMSIMADVNAAHKFAPAAA